MSERRVPDPFVHGRRSGDGDGAATLSGRLSVEVRGTRFEGHGKFLDRVSSTNDALQELARAGAPAGTFVVATEQTHGRGRQRRSWNSPPGLGLYLSVLLRPPPGPPTRWTLGAAVAACDACRSLGAHDASIKWPNDLVVGSDKLGGILVETRSSGTSIEELIIGLGVNVHHDENDLAALELPAVTSLRLAVASGIVGGRADLAGAYLHRLDEIATAIEDGAWDGVASAWLNRAPRAVDARVTVRAPDGTRWPGVSAGLADDGALRIRDAQGRMHELRQVDSVSFERG